MLRKRAFGARAAKAVSGGQSRERMVAVVLHHPERRGKFYRMATEKDLQVFQEAARYLSEKRQKLMEQWGFDPVPDEPIPLMSGTFNVPLYVMNTWGSLFNARQKLALITFTEKVRQAYQKMIDKGYDKEYVKAVVTYLGLLLTRIVDFTCNLARWKPDAEAVVQGLTRQAIAMVYDYTENNTICDSAGTWKSLLDRILKVIFNLTQIPFVVSLEVKR